MQYPQKNTYKTRKAVWVLVGLLGLATSTWVQDHNWTTKAEMPTARIGLASGVVQGKIYVIGGEARLYGLGLPTVEAYDPATDTWSRKTDLPAAISVLATSVVGEKSA